MLADAEDAVGWVIAPGNAMAGLYLWLWLMAPFLVAGLGAGLNVAGTTWLVNPWEGETPFEEVVCWDMSIGPVLR